MGVDGVSEPSHVFGKEKSAVAPGEVRRTFWTRALGASRGRRDPATMADRLGPIRPLVMAAGGTSCTQVTPGRFRCVTTQVSSEVIWGGVHDGRTPRCPPIRMSLPRPGKGADGPTGGDDELLATTAVSSITSNFENPTPKKNQDTTGSLCPTHG